ncbi:hypothetical protein BDN70DRAFT_820016 [Pholiota conissans]|uniref:Uncharacterized protein n=1 Tax=Pholiota conissans TaxID=109636 RepID=A0A9P6CLP9_9AGAR|nr:hypothetical protein BDN70DRAFT_820016 [Pholiota conissans]
MPARRPLIITDSENRIIAAFVCPPDGDDWDAVKKGAEDAILDAHKKCTFPANASSHRRGKFFVLNKRISHGGGQKCPGNIYNEKTNASTLANFAANENISRIAGHASASFATWAPNLYTYCEGGFEKLLEKDASLHRNFENSVWASFAVNFGPRTVCRRHRDAANLPFGWCGITALGDFNATHGGHLILWELGIAVEFPSGSTALIPSAAITHSNVPIARHETRYSFTQFTAGGLFRWVDQGFQSTEKYTENLSAHEQAKDLKRQQERCKLALSLFSTLSSIRDHQSARNSLISPDVL